MVTKGWVYLFYKNIDKMIDFLDNDKSVHTTQLVDYVSSSLHEFKNTSFKLKHLNNSLTFVTPLNRNLIQVYLHGAQSNYVPINIFHQIF